MLYTTYIKLRILHHHFKGRKPYTIARVFEDDEGIKVSRFAQVAIATVRRDRNHLPNSVGQVSFKLVERVDPIDLTSAGE